jgi:hypothetical protein
MYGRMTLIGGMRVIEIIPKESDGGQPCLKIFFCLSIKLLLPQPFSLMK